MVSLHFIELAALQLRPNCVHFCSVIGFWDNLNIAFFLLHGGRNYESESRVEESPPRSVVYDLKLTITQARPNQPPQQWQAAFAYDIHIIHK